MDKAYQLLPEICDLAKHAGQEILAVYEQGFSVSTKNDNTPLTEADIAAHNVIVAGLGRITAKIPVLSEESVDIPFSERKVWQTYWLVDPLDGTKEFINRNGEFTVNIALIHHGKSILGVIYCPVKELLYYATTGHGAFKQRVPDEAQKINTRKVAGTVMSVAGSRSHAGKTLNDFLAKLGKNEIFSMGSSLKSCLVAEGGVDIYPRFGPTSEWDTAAAQCIVEEAGGWILNLAMEPLIYNSKDSLLNPHFIVIGDSDYNWQELLP